MSSPTLDIGAVAKASGMAVSKIRYYEEKGLIQSIGRKGLKRVFSTEVMTQLALISLAKETGFSLSEMKNLFPNSENKEINRQQLIEKELELASAIQRLQAMAQTLRHIINCPEPNQLECPKFQKLLYQVAKSNGQ